MGLLNHNCPLIKVWVANRFLFDLDPVPGFTEGHLFGVSSIRGRAPGFHVMLSTGAHFRWLPLHAIFHEEPATPEASPELTELALWDCFSNNLTVIQWDYLKGHECNVKLGSGRILSGMYSFTIDWLPDGDCDTTFAFVPEQSKCGHVIALDNGWFTMQPSNRVLWKDGYFIGREPTASKMEYKTNTHVWHAENVGSFDVSKSDQQFYEQRPTT